MENTYSRGDLFYADLGEGVGSEQFGYRPVVIIQNDVGNRHSPTVIVAPISTRNGGRERLPTHCRLNAANGLTRQSIVLLEQIRTIDKQRLGVRLGALPPDAMARIDRALMVSLGLWVNT